MLSLKIKTWKNWISINKNFLSIFAAILFSIYRSFNPFEEDQKIFFATANFINLSQENFPLNILNTFELKPFLSRGVYFLFTKFSNFFHIYIDEPFKFIFFNQFILCILIIFTSISFAKSILNTTSIKTKYFSIVFLFTFTSLITYGSEAFMQVDHIALILSVLSLSFFLRESNIYLISGSLLLPLIIGIKGISLLYTFSILMIIIFFKKFNLVRMVYFCIGEILGLFVLLLSLPVLKNAALMQSRDNNISELVKNLLFYKHGIFTFIDCIPLGIISITIFYVIYNKKLLSKIKYISPSKFLRNLSLKTFIRFSAYLLFFISSIGYSILQVGFSYHYTSYVFILLISSLIIISYFPDIINKVLIFSSFSMIILYCFFWGGLASNIGNFIPSIKKISSKNIITFRREKQAFLEISSIVENSSLLFITDGVANFYLPKKKSPCFEFYPLSIQRLINRNEVIKKKTNYYETLNCINQYNGDFILIQNSWVPKTEYENIYPDLTKFRYFKSFEARNRKYILYEKL